MNIAFYCPTQLETFKKPWGFNDMREKGLGGSEQTVLLLSEQFVKKGYSVTVYQHTKKPRIEEGIHFKPISMAHKEVGDSTDLLIVWRNPSVILDFQKNKKPKKVVCWLHDMIPESELTPFAEVYDAYIVLSTFHKSYYPGVASSKLLILGHGVDVPNMDVVSSHRPFHLAYTSNYDRGLEKLLPVIHRLRAKFPELMLHVAYGFDTLDRLQPVDGLGKLRYEYWKEALINQLECEHVVHHGKVSQEKVWEILSECDLFTYPCHYPETFCLSVVQAQVAGCVPVIIPSGSLGEVCKWGWQSDKDMTQYESLLESILLDRRAVERERVLMLENRLHPKWCEIAERWEELLLDRKPQN